MLMMRPSSIGKNLFKAFCVYWGESGYYLRSTWYWFVNRVSKITRNPARNEPYGLEGDARPEEIKERLGQYRKTNEPVLEYYKG